MKKLAIAVAILAMTGLAGKALAGPAVNGDPLGIVAIAQINGTLDITITSAYPSSTSWDVGTQNGGTTQLSTAFAVQNTGSGLVQTYWLSCGNSANWTLGGVAGPDVFTMDAQFSVAAPGSWTAQHVLTGASVQAGPSAAGQFSSASADGAGTSMGESVNLWLRMGMPTTSSVGTVQQAIITIDAQTP